MSNGRRRTQAAERAEAVEAAMRGGSDSQHVRDTLEWLRHDDQGRKRTTRRVVREAYGPRPACVYCGGGSGTADHVVPRAKGGANRLGNLVPACRTCNGKKRDDDLAEFFVRFPKAAANFQRRAAHADPELRDVAERFVLGLTEPVK